MWLPPTDLEEEANICIVVAIDTKRYIPGPNTNKLEITTIIFFTYETIIHSILHSYIFTSTGTNFSTTFQHANQKSK